MNDSELNFFIENYIKKDQTKSAIMISAPWGTGKSFYIQNSLKPYIEKKLKYKCVVVSAYGLSSIEELNRSIYLESRIKSITKFNETMQYGMLAGKTIIKGVSSFFGVDLSLNKKDFQKLYKSIKLSDKLLIIEDLERAEMNVLSILGYVNNLTEQDGVKVILVANEQEILNKMELKEDSKDINASSKEYLRVKEKTIRDTIYYTPPIEKTLDSILKSFHCKKIDAILESSDNIISAINNEVLTYKNCNLRSVIFGVQKTIEIFDAVDFNYDKEFFKSVLFGNIAFSLKWKNNSSLRWTSETTGSSLGTRKYPLEKFSYDYFLNQILNPQDVKRAHKYYLQQKEFESKNKHLQTELNIIYNYYINQENNVVTAINYLLEVLLESRKFIPTIEYAKIGNYLIAIKNIIGQDQLIKQCLDTMVNNIGKEEKDFVEYIKYHDGIGLESEKSIAELKAFEKRLIDKYEENNNIELLQYTSGKLTEWTDFISKNRNIFIEKKKFVSLLNIEKLIKRLKKCSASDILEIRRAFRSGYSVSNLKDYFEDDIDTLSDLHEKLISLLKYSGFDKIQKKQVEYFIRDLDKYLECIKTGVLLENI